MNVGDYVRTKRGTFDRFITSHTQDNLTWYTFEDRGNITNPENYVIKSSSNIIDLIEVGDYVNGHKVFDDMRVDTDDYGNDFIEIGIEIDNMLNHYIREEDIKSIVTKEQFESMEYKVGE